MKLDRMVITETDEQFSEITSEIKKSISCAWEDDIHDSYLNYGQYIEKMSDEFCTVRKSVIEIFEEVEGIDIQEIHNIVENLCREAESV